VDGNIVIKENILKDFCPFLEIGKTTESKYCNAGINFRIVGANRELCQLCPFSDISDSPLCPNADLYAFLQKTENGMIITVRFDCLEDDLPSEDHCQECPDYLQPSSCEPEPGLSIPIQG